MSKYSTIAALLVMTLVMPIRAQEPAELAKKLANPVASLISVPLQYNYDENFGLDGNGSKSVLNIQPVWPFSLGEDWNLITRTIIPLVNQQDISPGTDESGLGDILQSFFFSPKKPVGGWIVAAGPVFLYPTASDEVLGGEKWGAGPTAVAYNSEKKIFRRAGEHDGDETFPGLLMLRTEGRLTFANAANAAEKMRALVEQYNPTVIVLECSAIPDIEYTALVMLTEAEQKLRERGVVLWLAALNPDMLKVINRSPLGEALGRDRMFLI